VAAVADAKKYLSWFLYAGIALGLVAGEVLLVKAMRKRREAVPPPEAPSVDDMALSLIGELPFEKEIAHAPAARPRWLKLPPIRLVTLSNAVMTVGITRPDDPGAYQDARFDWSGMIATLTYNGHTFFGGPGAKMDNRTPYPVFGTAEEFDAPVGFYEAKPGETFVKVGVGELVRPPQPAWYWWGLAYQIAKPGAWQVRAGPDWIEYEQELQGSRGAAYRYVKRVALDADRPVVKVSRSLENKGVRVLKTSHYCHNFVSVDNHTVLGPPWKVEFGYKLAPHPNPKYWRPRGLVEIRGSSLEFVSAMSDGALFLLMTHEPRDASANWFRLANPEAGVSVTIKGDRPVSRIAFYAAGGAICPEAFVQLDVEPGRCESWETVYTFEADPGKVPAKTTDDGWREKLKGAIHGAPAQ
jgi:hypothetical protein